MLNNATIRPDLELHTKMQNKQMSSTFWRYWMKKKSRLNSSSRSLTHSLHSYSSLGNGENAISVAVISLVLFCYATWMVPSNPLDYIYSNKCIKFAQWNGIVGIRAFAFISLIPLHFVTRNYVLNCSGLSTGAHFKGNYNHNFKNKCCSMATINVLRGIKRKKKVMNSTPAQRWSEK